MTSASDITPLFDRCNAGRHRIRPTDRPTHLLRCPVSLGITTLAIGGSHRNASRRQVSAVRRWWPAKQPHKTGWCPVLASTTGPATALQASSNTYLTGFTTENKEWHLAQWQQRCDGRKRRMRRKRFSRPKRKTVSEPALARRAAVRDSSRASLQPRSGPGPDFWGGTGARLEP
jgi:hypothetical protein